MDLFHLQVAHRGSRESHAAVDSDCRADHVVAGTRCEENRGARHVLVRADASRGIMFGNLIPAVARAGSIPGFVAVTVVILSMYGAGFATIPAYLKDLFGGWTAAQKKHFSDGGIFDQIYGKPPSPPAQ